MLKLKLNDVVSVIKDWHTPFFLARSNVFSTFIPRGIIPALFLHHTLILFYPLMGGTSHLRSTLPRKNDLRQSVELEVPRRKRSKSARWLASGVNLH